MMSASLASRIRDSWKYHHDHYEKQSHLPALRVKFCLQRQRESSHMPAPPCGWRVEKYAIATDGSLQKP
jgi:hypothetical protein